jgi:predicted metalloprotease with PDZ domain
MMRIDRVLIVCFLVCGFPSARAADNESKLDYTVTFVDAAQHRVHVQMSFNPETAGAEVQLPTWNALYQIRDFSKNLLAIKAATPDGDRLSVMQEDKTTWHIQPHPGWVLVDYDLMLDEAGPFGAQFNSHHAFLNLAQVLMYPVNGRELSITVHFVNVPPKWNLATSVPALSVAADKPGAPAGHVLHAENYDRLVDSPCELGEFAESDFEGGGAKYRVVVDADARDYQMRTLVESLKKITAAETTWMDDRPFETYVFIYHFPRGPAGGGMEHAYSTAIDISASQLTSPGGFNSVSAHEFFHLWNVKRIRPRSLEPIDYVHENYTRALWFSEGVTTTVADLALLNSGQLQPADYYQQLSRAITVLESRSAHLTQSAEESSLDTWLDKYPSYRTPERSINYYNKGDLLGVLLDLKLRKDSQGRHSLRDLFHELNWDYAKKGSFFPDSSGIRTEAEKLTGSDLRSFFDRYVSGTDELPFDELFTTVGLALVKEEHAVADPGFATSVNFTGPAVIDEVYGEQARQSGLHQGDEILSIDGQSPTRRLEQSFENMKPGRLVRITVMSAGAKKDIQLTLGQRLQTEYVLRESPQANAEQLARRAAWLRSEGQPSSPAPSTR